MRTLKPLILLGVFGLAGCFYPAERGKMMEARLDKLEAEKSGLENALNRQKELLAAQIPKLDGQVDAVQKALEKLDRASRSTNADYGVQLESVKGDLANLRGSIEQYMHQLTELQQELAAVKESAAQAAAEKNPKEEVKKKAAETERPADKKEFLDLVVKKLADDPEVGRDLANEWLRKYPKDPLAAKAHLALGNSWYADKKWREALGEFGDIFKNYAKSEYAPEALLKSSECFANLKMKDESRMMLEEIVSSYPKSDAAKTAKAKLADAKKDKKK